ncbi:hypothetical protein EV193_11628 [Herbihabitans rhizosphaerae]|uniref:Uncharacterized protein n=1 Tax=Herbihabitans rhizosphaerae TaxID=1872711 RepID=A0A4Q7KC10_9PSEU|nr:hypothetical protein [Herbihabitans rhizosphaerae]RZS30508.1 hypothetical protein EV193_11628 [Herbihabitans rhizosphaerae]
MSWLTWIISTLAIWAITRYLIRPWLRAKILLPRTITRHNWRLETGRFGPTGTGRQITGTIHGHRFTARETTGTTLLTVHGFTLTDAPPHVIDIDALRTKVTVHGPSRAQHAIDNASTKHWFTWTTLTSATEYAIDGDSISIICDSTLPQLPIERRVHTIIDIGRELEHLDWNPPTTNEDNDEAGGSPEPDEAPERVLRTVHLGKHSGAESCLGCGWVIGFFGLLAIGLVLFGLQFTINATGALLGLGEPVTLEITSPPDPDGNVQAAYQHDGQRHTTELEANANVGDRIQAHMPLWPGDLWISLPWTQPIPTGTPGMLNTILALTAGLTALTIPTGIYLHLRKRSQDLHTRDRD